jgi:3-deoxy-D-manno-octulosonate 8-phosphate phosphatase (KDO 8-P phosphatase)
MRSNLKLNIDKASCLKLVIFDVDGVMSDGRIIYSNIKEETKAFNVKDGLGIKLLQAGGLDTAIITGRSSEIVSKRAAELGITNLVQGRDDKLAATQELIKQLKLDTHEVAYMGDDLPDLAAIQYVGFGIAPNDACKHVLEKADFVCTAEGGKGAVREVCEFILQAQKKLDLLITKYQLHR